MIRVLLSSFLLTVLLTALAGACPTDPQRFLNKHYDAPKGVKAECGTIWKQWRDDSIKIHEERYAWLEMWSVDSQDNRTPTEIRGLILKAGYVFNPNMKDTRKRIYGDATYYFTKRNHQQLMVQLFSVGNRVYVVIGGR